MRANSFRVATEAACCATGCGIKSETRGFAGDDLLRDGCGCSPSRSHARGNAGYIGAAQREVLLAAPVLRVRIVAEALRVVVVERGVGVESHARAWERLWAQAKPLKGVLK